MSFGWEAERAQLDEETQNEEGLARFVKNPHFLSSNDLAVEAYPLLDQIVSTQISTDTRQVLDVLALAPVSLAPALLQYLSKTPRSLYKDLCRTSLLSRDKHRIRLLPLA